MSITYRPSVTTQDNQAAGRPYFDHLDYLKCYAITLVVALHVSASGAYQWHMVPATDWWLSTAFDAFARTCVPLFLMASGATLLVAARVEPVGHFLRRRVRRIIVPLIFWSLVYLADRKWLIGEVLTQATIVRYLATGTTFYHLPFFYYLFGLYLSAPVLALFAEQARAGTVVYFIILWGCVAGVQLASDLSGITSGVTVPAVAGFSGYFVLGRILRDVDTNGRAILMCLMIVVAGWLATLFGTYRLTAAADHLNELLFEYSRPSVIAMTIASFLVIGSTPVRRFIDRHPVITRFMRQAANLSFGVFLVHPLLMQVLLPRLHLTWNTGGPLIGIPVTTLATLVASAMVVWAIRRCPGIRALVA